MHPPVDRRARRRSLFDLAAGQGGNFTAAQARHLGYSYQAQAHHVAAGNWLRAGRGLFQLAEWPPGPHDDLARWALWSKGRAVVSHASALAVHDLGEFESGATHLTVPTGFTMRDHAVVLHVDDLPDAHVVDLGGFRATTPVRSLADVAAIADEDQLARAIDEATRRGLMTLAQLRMTAEAVDLAGALRIERAIQALAR
jgi:predicted transcriptional regulator of viral defense system